MNDMESLAYVLADAIDYEAEQRRHMLNILETILTNPIIVAVMTAILAFATAFGIAVIIRKKRHHPEGQQALPAKTMRRILLMSLAIAIATGTTTTLTTQHLTSIQDGIVYDSGNGGTLDNVGYVRFDGQWYEVVFIRVGEGGSHASYPVNEGDVPEHIREHPLTFSLGPWYDVCAGYKMYKSYDAYKNNEIANLGKSDMPDWMRHDEEETPTMREWRQTTTTTNETTPIQPEQIIAVVVLVAYMATCAIVGCLIVHITSQKRRTGETTPFGERFMSFIFSKRARTLGTILFVGLIVIQSFLYTSMHDRLAANDALAPQETTEKGLLTDAAEQGNASRIDADEIVRKVMEDVSEDDLMQDIDGDVYMQENKNNTARVDYGYLDGRWYEIPVYGPDMFNGYAAPVIDERNVPDYILKNPERYKVGTFKELYPDFYVFKSREALDLAYQKMFDEYNKAP